MLTVQWSRERIVELRERLGLTQQEFATRLDCSVSTISGWESGRGSPPSKKFQRQLDQLDRDDDAVSVEDALRRATPEQLITELGTRLAERDELLARSRIRTSNQPVDLSGRRGVVVGPASEPAAPDADKPAG